MNLTELDGAPRKLRLSGMVDVLDTRLRNAQAERLPPLDLIAMLVNDELQRRHDRLLERRRAQARVRDPGRSLDAFDFTFNKKMNRALLFELATGRFITQREDILLVGPPVRGRSIWRRRSARRRFSRAIACSTARRTSGSKSSPTPRWMAVGASSANCCITNAIPSRHMLAEGNPQPYGQRGSLRWIQTLVEHHPAMLTDAARAAAGRAAEWTVDWLSPRRYDAWSEYRDAGFLTTLRLPQLVDELERFWPRGGPQWDALGVASDGVRVLVEAKAHVAELQSKCGAGPVSLAQIRSAMDITKESWGVGGNHDWLAPYYQYANRLAHLQFLRQHGIDALLLFVYFVGDHDMRGPTNGDEWKAALEPLYSHLGLPDDMGARGIVNVFLPVATIATLV